MVFDHKVKYHGVWYMPFEEIKEEPEVTKASGSSFVDAPKYKKSDITCMKVSDLRKVVMDTGAENADSMTGAEMKEYLINLFGL